MCPDNQPINNIFLAVCRFGTADDLPVFGDVSEGLHQALGILPRVAEQSEEPRFPAIVRVGLVQKIVEHLAAIDDGKVSVAELHVARIVPRGQKGSQDNRFKVRLHHPLHAKLLGDSIQFIQLEAFAAPRAPSALRAPTSRPTLFLNRKQSANRSEHEGALDVDTGWSTAPKVSESVGREMRCGQPPS